ncbi:galactonate dehydratase [Deinococcus deserti]|uniref:Putative galactonate dehydratase n=1 Tax=Deinococcus deserti (strain DSM 17065 / CIP 109153 / LMG 22923 / VCD115) TaxID=546414 RepID=C1D2H9_DEIDV|nr:galactonate dehydratase [Deinococcus deserti]ACO47618.1 putative galactonate dehydratase [Deinococcus deserti VCD115]
MKITRLESFLVPPRWLFLKIETDEGVSGWGEPVVEGRAHTVQAAVNELADLIVGRDPGRIEDLWQLMHRGGFYRGGAVFMSAIAGIDQALWDIKGKVFGAPVHSLLGGQCRDRMRVYSWIGGDRPSDVAAAAHAAMSAGFTAIKMNATEEMTYLDVHSKIDSVLNRVQAVRDATTPDFGIAVDFHGRLHLPMARVLARELDPMRLMFIEEPVLSENIEALREIRRVTTTPLALGERLYSRWEFKAMLHEGLVDVIQPDLSHAGGITECRKIASMAEAYDVALAPHCPLGPIALAACLQVDAVAHNAAIQEQSLGIHYNQGSDLLDYVKDKSVFQYADGYVGLPQGPGLGIEVDEDFVRAQAATEHRWRNPLWRHADGSVAEW